MKLVVGGGAILDVNEIFNAITELAGGSGCRIGVIPLASESPYESWKNHSMVFEKSGAKPVLVDLTLENCNVNAFSSEIVNLILSLDGVFFTGGSQDRIVKGLIVDGNETPALKAIRMLSLSGKVISGSSAGAAIMSNPMIYGGMDMDVMVGRGLGFLKDGEVIVDQHFIQRGRFPRLFEALWKTDVRVGIGVDEGTALKVIDDICEVMGRSVVILIEMKCKDSFKLSYLSRGDSINLNNFEVHVGVGKKLMEKPKDTSKGKTYSFDILNPHGFRNTIDKLYRSEDGVVEALVMRVLEDKDNEKIGYAYRFVFEKGADTVFYSESGDEKVVSAKNINLRVERKPMKLLLG
jgi:cyanophycinase